MLLNREVERLNRRLGESLGMVRSGTLPRFCWAWAPDIPYWSTRLGPVWVLTQWQKPGMTEQDWHKHFEGRYPYPSNGMHHALPESALAPGILPTEKLTQNYIWALDRQMSTTFAKELSSVNDDMARQEQQRDDEWTEYVQNQNYSAYDTYVQTGYRGEQQNGNV